MRSAGRPTIELPRNVMSPALGSTRPEMARRVVDLPAPLAPIRVTTVPSGTDSEIPCSAAIPP
jgi:hypothetical protein